MPWARADRRRSFLFAGRTRRPLDVRMRIVQWIGRAMRVRARPRWRNPRQRGSVD